MTHTINLFYFPKGLRYTTPVFAAIAIYLMFSAHNAVRIAGVAIIVISLFILSAKYVTIIDVQRKQFIDAFVALTIDFRSEKTKFNTLHKIIITKGTYTQNVQTRSQSRSFQWSDYSATLIFDNDQTLDLVTNDSKKDVINFVQFYSRTLGVPIEDRC